MRIVGLYLFALLLAGPIAINAQDETAETAVVEEVVTETAEAVEVDPLAALDTGDTAFMLVCAALVLLMTPGLAFFYGGLVRARRGNACNQRRRRG